MFAFPKVELFIAVGHIIRLGGALGKTVRNNAPLQQDTFSDLQLEKLLLRSKPLSYETQWDVLPLKTWLNRLPRKCPSGGVSRGAAELGTQSIYEQPEERKL
jgi:hypothetical protein